MTTQPTYTPTREHFTQTGCYVLVNAFRVDTSNPDNVVHIDRILHELPHDLNSSSLIPKFCCLNTGAAGALN